VLAAARPYLGRVVGVWSEWTPLTGRGDPWRFSNVRVA
jgi:homospermidine synthase